jgi:branched-chain amino acid transport system substrate-binding protein
MHLAIQMRYRVVSGTLCSHLLFTGETMLLKLNVVAAAVVALSAGFASAQTVVTIAHVGPTSGAIAHLGKDNENGAKMAVEELNAAGVTIGGKKVTLKLMTEDDAADPKQGTAVAQKLVDAKVVGVVGHLNSGTTIPASKLYSDAGIPQVSPSATNPKYTRQGFKTAFRLVADDTQLGGTLGRYAVKELKGKSIAVIDDRTAYGQGVAEEFSKAVVAAGGTVVAKEFTTDKATDFNSILTTIKGKKADVVFFGGMDAVAGPMLRQMKSLGINAKFMGGDGICSTELVKLGGDAISDNQVYCAEAGGVEGQGKAGMEKFKTAFKAKFGADVQVYAPYVYDGVKLMVAAMVKAGSSDPAKYLPVLAATKDYAGVTGPITFDEKGDIKNGALTLKTVKGGKLTELAVIR